MYLLCQDVSKKMKKHLKISQGGRENAHFHCRRIILIRYWLMQVSSALLHCRAPHRFHGQKSSLQTEFTDALDLPSKQDAAATEWKCINLTVAKSVWSFWRPLAKTDRNDHILFAFSTIYVNNIVSENTNIFRKSQGPTALYFFIQRCYMT